MHMCSKDSLSHSACYMLRLSETLLSMVLGVSLVPRASHGRGGGSGRVVL